MQSCEPLLFRNSTKLSETFQKGGGQNLANAVSLHFGDLCLGQNPSRRLLSHSRVEIQQGSVQVIFHLVQVKGQKVYACALSFERRVDPKSVRFLDYPEMLAKASCRVKFWPKFPSWRAVSGRSLSRSLRRSFSRSFRACSAGTFRARKTSAKTSVQNSHDPAQQNWRNSEPKMCHK